MAALLVPACKKAPPADTAAASKGVDAKAPVHVETAEVRRELVPRYMTLTGSISADVSSEVAANVSGRVTRTYVERGMPVKAGQVLASIDSRAAGLQVAAAAAQSQAAQTQLNLARQDCERAEGLFRQGAISKAEYERQTTQCTAQLYQANAAQANADLAGKAVGDATIRAPFAGIVGERFVNVGEFVQPPTRVASVFAVDPVRVSLSVPESAVGSVKVGQSLVLSVSSSPGKEFPATVRFLSPALRPTTRDLIVEASAPNPDGELHPGMFATARVAIGEEEQPTVPVRAIKADGTVKRLFAVRDGRAFEMVVRTGVEKDGRVVVYESLAAGEKVVVAPPAGLEDGSPVQ